jgi:hypothetical protein
MALIDEMRRNFDGVHLVHEGIRWFVFKKNRGHLLWCHAFVAEQDAQSFLEEQLGAKSV